MLLETAVYEDLSNKKESFQMFKGVVYLKTVKHKMEINKFQEKMMKKENNGETMISNGE